MKKIIFILMLIITSHLYAEKEVISYNPLGFYTNSFNEFLGMVDQVTAAYSYAYIYYAPVNSSNGYYFYLLDEDRREADYMGFYVKNGQGYYMYFTNNGSMNFTDIKGVKRFGTLQKAFDYWKSIQSNSSTSSNSENKINNSATNTKTTSQTQNQQQGNFKATHRVATNDGSNLRLRGSMSTSGNVITSLDNGSLVQVLETGAAFTDSDGNSGNWMRVSTQSGTSGWCFGAYLRTISQTSSAGTNTSAAKEQSNKKSAFTNFMDGFLGIQ